jgi:hypothetical protein
MDELLNYAKAGNDIIIGGGRYTKDPVSRQTYFVLAVFQPLEKKKQLIELDFLPHGIAVDPLNPLRLLVCEKIGPGAAVIDLNTMKLVQKLQSPANRRFYGHGAFSADGETIYTTETYKGNKRGTIVERDAISFDELGEFPSFGDSPHECQLIDGGATLVVTNGGGNMNGSLPNISYIDVASRQLMRQEKPTTSALNTGHFYTSDNNDLVVVSAPRDGNRIRLGGLSIQPSGKAMKTATSPKKVVSQMLGESLSVAIHQSIALVTHPDGNMISFWDTTNRKFIKKLALELPRGVTLSNDGKYFIVSYGQMASIVNISTKELQLQNDSITDATYLAGSHIYNWTKMVQELCS